MNGRRGFLQSVLAGTGMMASAKLLSAHEMEMPAGAENKKTRDINEAIESGPVHALPVLVETPDVPDLPYRMDRNVKEFHLIAEPVKQEHPNRGRKRAFRLRELRF